MSEDNREKILQQNMLNLFEYIETIDKRLKVLEEEYMRYDFGYDPVETLRKRFEEMAGFDIWKVKFAMDKPDKIDPNPFYDLSDTCRQARAHHGAASGHTRSRGC